MAEIINLNRARKARAKASAKQSAEANRQKFGRSRLENFAQKLEQARDASRLDGHKLDDK